MRIFHAVTVGNPEVNIDLVNSSGRKDDVAGTLFWPTQIWPDSGTNIQWQAESHNTQPRHGYNRPFNDILGSCNGSSEYNTRYRTSRVKIVGRVMKHYGGTKICRVLLSIRRFSIRKHGYQVNARSYNILKSASRRVVFVVSVQDFV